MRIDIITLFPEFFNNIINHSIISKAIEKELIKVHLHNLRDYSDNKQKSVDDYQFGGGSGMVMTIQPIDCIISKLKKERDYDEIIYLSADGERLNQQTSNMLSTNKNIILLCGHYKGVDQRIRDNFITQEISIGDFVLSGGELAAAVLCDSIVRLIPGVLGNESSALNDSFQDNILAPPIYTRPSNYEGLKVPEILLSGNTPKIESWREDKSIEITKKLRPDLFKD